MTALELLVGISVCVGTGVVLTLTWCGLTAVWSSLTFMDRMR